jgi:hypothetical protein
VLEEIQGQCVFAINDQIAEKNTGESRMQRFQTKLIAHFFILVIAGTSSVAQDFKQYPGSRFEEKPSQQPSAVDKETEVQVYTTGDSFEKVYGFYKSLYKEVAVPFPKQTLPNGKELKWAFFVLDGAKDLVHSSYWMKVQRPYVRTVDNKGNFQDVRDMSAIQTVRRHGPAFKKSGLLDIGDRRNIGFTAKPQRFAAFNKNSSSRRFS